MAQFKDNSDTELAKTLADKREELRVSRFGASGSRARNVKEARSIRRDVARILTEMRARVLAGMSKKA